MFSCSFRREPVVHSAEQEQEADAMLARVNTPNDLQQRVEQNRNLGARARWEPLDAVNVNDFPRLDMDFLRDLTFGVYQISLARNYADEHLQNGTYDVCILRKLQGFLHRGRIPGSKSHISFLFILDCKTERHHQYYQMLLVYMV